MSEQYLPTGRTRAEFLAEMNGNLHHDAKYLFEHVAALQNTISVLSASYKKALDRTEAAEATLEEVRNDLQDILSVYSLMTRAKIRLQLEDMRDELEAALKEKGSE